MPEKNCMHFILKENMFRKMLKKRIYTGSDMKNYSLVQCTLNGINIMMTHNQI